MFSPSALGGSICLRCQIRAVTRRAPPLLAAAQIRSRRRQYASNATACPPEDVTPAAEIKEHVRETEQRLSGSQQPLPDETSPSTAVEQTLPDPPRDAVEDAPGPPGDGLTDDVVLDVERNNAQNQSPAADADLPESALTSKPDCRAQDKEDEWDKDQDGDLSVGQTQQDNSSRTTRALESSTNPRFRKVFWANRDGHIKHGHASLKPPRDLECPKCRAAFGTKKLLHHHLSKRSCSPKADTAMLAENDDGQKMEDILSQAAAEFSRHEASSRKYGRHRAAEGYSTWDMEVNIQPDIKRNEKRAEEEADDSQIQKSGRTVRITRGRKREHRRGGMVLVEDASRLDVDTLGKAAEVIVLRDGRQRERRDHPVEASSEEAMDGGLNIEEFLDEYCALSLDDVMKNIHGLKPERQIVSAREFKSLFNTLLGGFTIIQLEQYVVWYREQPILEMIKDEVFGEGENIETLGEEPTVPEDELLTQREYAWMTEQAHWTPDVDGAVEEAQYPLAGYITKSMPPKQRLVIQLMRGCWDISIQELLDGNGRVDIRVRDLEFELLTLGNQKWLQRISRLFLKEGQRIEVRRSGNLVRIKAPKAVAETCVHALGETLERTKTKALKLDHVPMQRLDAGTLEELGRITNSVVQFSPDREAIHVTWIDLWDKESQATLEDVADMIFRLLVTAAPSARTSNSLTVYPNVEGNGRLLEDHSNKEKLSWTDRRREWARLCLPLASKQHLTDKSWPPTADILQFKVEPTEEDLALPSSTYQQKVDNFYRTVSPVGLPKLEEEKPKENASEQEPEATDATTSGWKPFKITTNASFGRLLHLNEPKLAENVALPNISTSLANWPRRFAPLIPSVTELELPAWSPYDGTKDRASTILMRFVPYSEGAGSNIHTERAPPLELRLSGDDHKVTAIHSLRAINRTSVSDILLPAEHVDVRAVQQEYAELPSAAIDAMEGTEPLREFLNKSRLEISKGQLVTPPRLHNLGLPRWLLAPYPRADAANAKAKPRKAAAAAKGQPPQYLPHTPEGNKIRRTSYLFAGLEWHHSVETTYDGWKLVYTSIEAGAGGGRRAELSLEAVPGYDIDLRRTREAINATFFLRSVYQLATGQAGRLVQRAGGEEQVRTSVLWVR